MDVYGEYLFIENFMAGYGIIRLTALMCGRRPSYARMACGSLLCGMFAFILFINIPGIVQSAAEIFFAAMLITIVFSPQRIKNVVRLTAVFYAISFLLGGAAIAFIFASGCNGAVGNGIFYIGSRMYFFMITGMGTAGIMLSRLVDFIKKSSSRGSTIVRVNINIMGKNIECTAKIDTGNYLREPVSGKPVSIIEKSSAERAWGELYRNHMLDNRIRVIPYSSIGEKCGSMIALRCDDLVIDRGTAASGCRRIFLQNAYIGLYDGKFSSDSDEEKYTLLLQPDMVDKGCFAI